MVKFAHIADCHLGAFGRNPSLREYNLKAFEKAIDISLDRNVDFIVIAGDLFHNPHPDMEVVNRGVRSLMKARSEGVNIYSVYGSHDFKISQASLIDVLESADVFKKVVNYLEEEGTLEVQEEPSGVSMTGLSGRKNRADISYFEELEFPEPEGESIFVFHSPIAELKPADIHEKKSLPLSLMPDGFTYYAGGHLHKRIEHEDEKNIYYPGPTFGDSYTDLERDERGFYIVEDWEPEYIPLKEPKIVSKRIDADGLKVLEVKKRIETLLEEKMEGGVLLLKVSGTLAEGVPSDIDFGEVKKKFEEKGFETVYLNRRGLEGKEVETVQVKEEKEEELEERLLEEYTGESDMSVEFRGRLLNVLKVDQNDGETRADYENRIWKEAWELIKRRDEYEEEENRKMKEKEEQEQEEEKQDDRGSDKEELEKEQEESTTKKSKPRSEEGQISLTDFGGEQ